MSNLNFKTDIFIPKNKHKYLGKNIDHIVYRSSWEKRVFEFCDNNQNVLGWSSEPFAINYLKPDPNHHNNVKPARYYPDLYVEYVDKNKLLIKELIEMKPLKYTKPSRSKNPQTKIFENYQYIVNMAKWQAAQKWCDEKGYSFRILTEKYIFKNR